MSTETQLVPLEPSEVEAIAAIERIDQTSNKIERSYRFLERMGDGLAIKNSQAIAAIVGGGAGALATTVLMSAPFGPLGMIIGAGLSVLAWRGMPDRQSQNGVRRLTQNTAIIRSEIEEAKAAGAPQEVIDGLWSLYYGHHRTHAEDLNVFSLGRPVSKSRHLPTRQG